MRRRAPSERQCGRKSPATDDNGGQARWRRAPGLRSFGGLTSGMAEGDAAEQREMAKRITELRACRLGLDDTAEFDGIAAARRKEAAGRAIELAGNHAWNREGDGSGLAPEVLPGGLPCKDD